MPIDERFYTAFLSGSSKRRIFGRDIKPYSLRHHMVLTAMGHPFVTDGKLCTTADVISCAIVLSGTTVEEMLRPPTFRDSFHGLMMRLIRGYFGLSIVCLRQHIEECGSVPKFWEKEGKSKDRGVPWEARLVSNLAVNGVPLEDVMTMPLGQAMWLYTSWAIGQGADADMISTEDEAIMKRLEEERENK